MEFEVKKYFALLIDNVISSLLDYQVKKLNCEFNKHETKNIKYLLIRCKVIPNLKKTFIAVQSNNMLMLIICSLTRN